MSYKVGDKVRTITDRDCKIGIITDIDEDVSFPYQVRVGDNDNYYYSEDMLEPFNEKTYSDGLNDAWELARKIVLTTEMGGICYDDFKKIFGVGNFVSVLRTMTAQQALAKIEAYEESQQIQIGDIVRRISDDKEYLIITEEEDDSAYKYGVIVLKSMTIDRITGDLLKFEKTGRHIDISSILEQIRGGMSSGRNNSKRND